MYSAGLLAAFLSVSSTALASDSDAVPYLAARHPINNTHTMYAGSSSQAPVVGGSDLLNATTGHWHPTPEAFQTIKHHGESGWRLRGNPLSAYRLRTVNGTGPFLGWNTTADGDDSLPEVRVWYSGLVDYYPAGPAAASAPTPHARELVANDADAPSKYGPWATIPTTHTVFIHNGGSHRHCPGSDTLSIHSNFTYADGTVNTVTGTDYINMGTVSGSLERIDIAIQEYPAFSATFHFNSTKPWPLQVRKRTDTNITYSLGATQGMDIWLCGDSAAYDD